MVQKLAVTPAYLAQLKKDLEQAQKYINAGFSAPTDVGSYPNKLVNTHGVTSRMGSSHFVRVISSNRADVQKRLATVIASLVKSLDTAKAAYEKVDESQGDILEKQVNTSGA
jgi:hypothetical protein